MWVAHVLASRHDSAYHRHDAQAWTGLLRRGDPHHSLLLGQIARVHDDVANRLDAALFGGDQGVLVRSLMAMDVIEACSSEL